MGTEIEEESGLERKAGANLRVKVELLETSCVSSLVQTTEVFEVPRSCVFGNTNASVNIARTHETSG
jgi:hypothetical protein